MTGRAEPAVTTGPAGGRRPTRPALEPLFSARVALAPMLDVGPTPLGRRRVIPITGGEVLGPALRGRVLPGGADWQLVRPDGVALLEAHYTLEADDGALVYVRNTGLRSAAPDVLEQLAAGADVDPASYYFRTVPRFETGHPDYAWLNTLIAVGSGARQPGAVLIDFYRVT